MIAICREDGTISIRTADGKETAIKAGKIARLVYFPSTDASSKWRDDALFIYLEGSRPCGKELPEGWDHAIWGEDIVPFLIAARVLVGYDIQPLLDDMAEKERLFSSLPGKEGEKSLADLIASAESAAAAL